MTVARKVPSHLARGVMVAALLATTALPMVADAQAVATATPPPAQATAQVQPQGMSESVAAVVNSDIISTYDLGQRMRLLIATSGVQPTEATLPQFQQEALVGLVDERLQLQELRKGGEKGGGIQLKCWSQGRRRRWRW